MPGSCCIPFYSFDVGSLTEPGALPATSKCHRSSCLGPSWCQSYRCIPGCVQLFFIFLNVDSGDLNLGLLVLRQKVPFLAEPSVQLQKLSSCYGGGGRGW